MLRCYTNLLFYCLLNAPAYITNRSYMAKNNNQNILTCCSYSINFHHQSTEIRLKATLNPIQFICNHLSNWFKYAGSGNLDEIWIFIMAAMSRRTLGLPIYQTGESDNSSSPRARNRNMWSFNATSLIISYELVIGFIVNFIFTQHCGTCLLQHFPLRYLIGRSVTVSIIQS